MIIVGKRVKIGGHAGHCVAMHAAATGCKGSVIHVAGAYMNKSDILLREEGRFSRDATRIVASIVRDAANSTQH